MNLLKLLFSFEGNINRLSFFYGTITVFLFMLLFSFIPSILFMLFNMQPHVARLMAGLFYGIAALVFLSGYVVLAKKRLSDMKWSLWLLAMTFIPIVSNIIFLILLLVPGKINKQ